MPAPGRNFEEMSQITPETAVHYSFYSPSGSLGPVTAFEELLSAGCTLATEDWVRNHWGLILWKQAGMLCLDPTEARRWSWEGTIDQLRYRCALAYHSTLRSSDSTAQVREGTPRGVQTAIQAYCNR